MIEKQVILVLDCEISSEVQVVWGEVETVKFLFIVCNSQLKKSFWLIWVTPRNHLTFSRFDSPPLSFIAPLPHCELDSVALIHYHLCRPGLIISHHCLLTESHIHYLRVLLKVPFDGDVSRLVFLRVPAQVHTFGICASTTCWCLGQGDGGGPAVG